MDQHQEAGISALARLVTDLVREARYVLRTLRRSPGFSATVVLTLGLGIGANAAMLGIVDRLMFRPVACMRDPDGVHRLYWQWHDRGNTVTAEAGPYTRYLDLRRWTSSFATLAAFADPDLPVLEGRARVERPVAAVSASFFDLFDVRPELGRVFTAAEDEVPRGADVVVLSHGFWKTAFGARDVLGESVQVGNIRGTVIGVLPASFQGVGDDDPPVAYVPITTYAASTGTDDAQTFFSTYRWGWVRVLARRGPGVSVDAAEEDARQALRRSWRQAEVDNRRLPALADADPRVAVSAVRPGAGPNPPLHARTALWLSGVATLVLLIACANVGNLTLMRGLGRRREAAVRRALGLGRIRVGLLPVLEGLLLALGGGLAAILIAGGVTVAVGRFLLDVPLGWSEVLVDGRTLMVLGALATLSGALVGALPLLLGHRVDLASALRSGGRGSTTDGTRLRAALLTVQTALSVVLLAGTVLFVGSLRAVRAMRMGYDPSRVLLVNRVIGGDAFEDSVQVLLRRELLHAAQALPEVEAAAWVSSKPLVSTSTTELFIDGTGSTDALGTFTYQATTPDYFRVMGTRILRGRGITGADLPDAEPVALVSQSMAARLWPGEEPLGKCFRERSETAPCRAVVGIVEDIVQRSLQQTDRFHYYVPIEQQTRTWGNGLVLKLRGDPARLAESVRAALQSTMAGDSYLTVRPLEGVVADARRSWRMGASLFTTFGFLALVLAAVGLYAAMGYDVAQRKPELGLRIALGAEGWAVVALVMGRGLRVVATGVAGGVAACLLASRRLQPLLFEQSARDGRVYAAAAAIMLLVALVATAAPAFRATRIDPARTLRAE